MMTPWKGMCTMTTLRKLIETFKDAVHQPNFFANAQVTIYIAAIIIFLEAIL